MPSTTTSRLEGLETSVAVKPPCRVATTANITLSGLQSIDGVTVAAGDRVLVKDQTSAVDNGIWKVGAGAWTRALDFDGTRDAVGGTQVSVISGSTNSNSYWRVDGAGEKDIGTDSLTFVPAFIDDSASATFLQAGAGAVARTVQSKLRDVVSVKDFGAVGDGTTNDYAAVAAAVTALPATGGTVIFPDATGYKLGTTVTTAGKAVRFLAGHTTITGPATGAIFDLQDNGSSFVGSGPGATILKMTAPSSAPVMPVVTTTLTGDAVSARTITSVGSNLRSTPLTQVSASPTEDDAALIATVHASNGQITECAIVEAGSGYVGAPTLSFIGGGYPAIKINEPQHCKLTGFSIDMSSIANAVGIYHFGGWYADISNIDVMETTRHASAISLLIDSHTNGVAGTGSYGGVYVCKYSNIVAKRTAVIGHDTSTATTLHFDTLDATNVHIEAAVGITLTNPVIQGNSGAYLDLVNVDSLTALGGDFEGSAQIIRARGSCNNIGLYNTLGYSATGQLIYGPIGDGWSINLADSTATVEPLVTGSGGSGGYAFQNTGWTVKHRLGVNYAGDTMVYGSNIKLTSATAGDLDDVSLGATAFYMDTNGQILIKSASAGANPRTLSGIAQISASGIGYITGAGGAVTQATSRTTGVTLNKATGAITLVSAAGSTSWQSFTVTNSAVAATDTVIVSQKSGTDLNMIHVTAVGAGSFRITFATTGGTTVEQPVFNFSVIKAVAA